MAGTQIITTSFTMSGREDVEGAMGIPAAPMWIQVFLCLLLPLPKLWRSSSHRPPGQGSCSLSAVSTGEQICTNTHIPKTGGNALPQGLEQTVTRPHLFP